MPSASTARLTQAGVLEVRHGLVRMTDEFRDHLALFQDRPHLPWDTVSTLEMALATWDGCPGEPRDLARAAVRFLPPGPLAPAASFPVLDAFLAA